VTPVAIALGSNLGPSIAHMQCAVELLSKQVERIKVSGIYKTAPMYVLDQPAFFNAALVGQTLHGPLGLLHILKSIEREVGRLPRVRYGPREIDLDLISYGSLSLRSNFLQIPHPKIGERRFVLLPLAEIEPSWDLATMGVVSDLLAQTESQAGDVVLYKDAVLSVSSHG
jgi:2-amino-4-hydroxy-6-hydroxymethyldihydropteridine diphosphokinase